MARACRHVTQRDECGSFAADLVYSDGENDPSFALGAGHWRHCRTGLECQKNDSKLFQIEELPERFRVIR